MGFINGKAYRFTNGYYLDHALNVYGTNAASTGRNVCLFSDDPNDIMQKWIIKSSGNGYRLHSAVNSAYVLDCSDGSLSNSYKNNAHLCATSQTSITDSQVEFEYVSDNIYKIYLPGKKLYLTATNNTLVSGLPASSISTSTALTGGSGGQSNVYWAPASTSSKQQWKVSPSVDGGSSNPYAALNWRYVYDDKKNCLGYYGYDPVGAYHLHWGIDVICDSGTAIKSPAKGTVYAVGGSTYQHSDNPNVNIDNVQPHSSMGYFVVLKMDKPDPVTGRTMYVRFLHLRDVSSLRYKDTVYAGNLIGYTGNTGLSDTAHLHLDVNTKTSAQHSGNGFSISNTINPVNFFPDVSFPDNYYNYGVK